MTISHASNITRPPKVSIHDGKAVTTTDDVAAYFGKQAHHVVQKVESLDCSKDFTIRNFSRMVKNKSIGSGAERQVVYYEMTKDGFVFLVMGFTGKRAAAFKEAYIAEFNRMEAMLRQPHSLPTVHLTIEQQGAIKALVKSRIDALPQSKRAKAAISLWSALKSHFGVSYKAIAADQFTDALSLVARLTLDGEALVPLTNRSRYHFPLECADPHDRGLANAWMTPRVILDIRNRAPELELLEALERDGHDITGAKIRIHAMYDITGQFVAMQKELATVRSYLSTLNDMLKGRSEERGLNVCFAGPNKGRLFGGFRERGFTR
ncbi:Rha family transcriptional regulator [Edwardsiella tarda]|uniref:Rha family transcriptional regulator n=1 Tax=Edwardsiella TaxID=635 RepID=UPI00351C4DE5